MIDNPYKDIFISIENGLWEHDVRVDEINATPYKYDDETFRACIKIFMSSMMWKLWEVQEKNNSGFDIRCEEATKVGQELNSFIKKWTGIDSRDLYK